MSSNHSSHHHHHSSHSSRSHKSKRDYKNLRTVFAFLLFLSVFVFSVGINVNASFLNEEKVADIFTNSEYVTALYDDINEYAGDYCLNKNIPEVKVSYEAVSEIEIAYILGTFSLDEQYGETSYSVKLDEFENELKTSLENTVKEKNISVYSTAEEGAKGFAKAVRNYTEEKINFVYLEKVQSVINIGRPAVVAVTAISGVLTLVFALLTVSIGNKLHRNVRSASHAVCSAALLDFIGVLSYGIVSISKELVIYPLYLRDSIMRFMNNGVLTVLATSVLLFFISMIINSIVWKLKAISLDS